MSKNWVPKQVGGVRVPKRVRRAGRRLSNMSSQPLFAALAAPVIAAAATSIVRSPKARGLASGLAARAKQSLAGLKTGSPAA